MDVAFLNAMVLVGNDIVLERATVLVQGDRLVTVVQGEAAVPRSIPMVDVAEHTLLPGFIDCHVHLCLGGGPDPASEARQASLPALTLHAADSARRTLMAGVTSVRDMGGIGYVELAVRDAVRAGVIVGPRIHASGRLICMTGGHGWLFGGRQADGIEEIRKAVREQLKAGANCIKFAATGGVMTPGVEPGSAQLTEEELRAGVEEAHKADRKTAAHAQGTQGILNAIRAGIDSIEHGTILNEETVELLVARRIPVVPTLLAGHNILLKGREYGLAPHVIEKSERIRPLKVNSFEMARRKGVFFAMGTDAGTPFNRHGENLKELNLMVQWGLTPMQAIQAGTSNAALVIGMEKEVGTLEKGKLADLVVVKGNPLADIRVLADPNAIKLVMKGGRIVFSTLESKISTDN